MQLQPIPQLPQDKANHVIYGVAIYLCLAPFVGHQNALLASCVGGALKEVYDRCHRDKHTPEVLDWAATTAGGLACYVAHLIK